MSHMSNGLADVIHTSFYTLRITLIRELLRRLHNDLAQKVYPYILLHIISSF